MKLVDGVQVPEDNIGASDNASKGIPLRGRRVRHDVQGTSSNSGDLCVSNRYIHMVDCFERRMHSSLQESYSYCFFIIKKIKNYCKYREIMI